MAPELCQRLGCGFGRDYAIHRLKEHFTPEERAVETDEVCHVCKDEHVTTLRNAGYVVLRVEGLT